jgi:flagellar hook-associated protein 1 FlgK
MSTIFGSLSAAAQALAAQQYGLEITQKNIANASTPAYSRQRVAFTPSATFGSGEAVGSDTPSVSVESYRDAFVDYRVSRELQGQGEYDAVSGALQQVETLVNETNGAGLQKSLSDFFNSFSTLANTPEDITLRQQVIAQGGALANQFQRLYSQLHTLQVSQDRSVSNTVTDINSILQKIAQLNPKIQAAAAAKTDDESTLRDTRQQLLDQLSGLIDTSYFETENGTLTVTTRQGQVLVIGDEASTLEAESGSSGSLLQVTVDGANVTSKIGSGKLGGLLKVRDRMIVDYMDKLDDLAATVIARVNEQHTQGVDYSGAQGGDFFSPFVQPSPGSNAGAAGGMALAISDPLKIAAASPGGGPGSNGNANLLAAIKSEPLMNGGAETVTQYYADYIFNIGVDMKAADDSLTTQNQILLQLQNQRDSSSGVNLDEEAVNIIKFQKAYEASARMIQVWNILTDDIVNLLGT